jgi:arylsulfatase A-like enzyme
VWLHYFEPHDPYLPTFPDDMGAPAAPEDIPLTGNIRATPVYQRNTMAVGDPFAGGVSFTEAHRQFLVDLYDAEVRYVDRSVGEFLEFLRAERLYDEALIVLSSDHGESLGERGLWTHGRSLYEPEVRVPLIVKMPGQARGERVSRPVQAIDIFPTIAAVVEQPDVAVPLQGSPLHAEGERAAFAFFGGAQVIRRDRWKLIDGPRSVQLFDLEADPTEQHDLAASNAGIVEELRARGREHLEALELSRQALDRGSAATIERLRALGYLR